MSELQIEIHHLRRFSSFQLLSLEKFTKFMKKKNLVFSFSRLSRGLLDLFFQNQILNSIYLFCCCCSINYSKQIRFNIEQCENMRIVDFHLLVLLLLLLLNFDLKFSELVSNKPINLIYLNMNCVDISSFPIRSIIYFSYILKTLHIQTPNKISNK